MIDFNRFLSATVFLAALSSPSLAQIPEPDPNDLPAVIDWVLETNGCTATESQIYDAIKSRSDMWTANIVIVNWGESPNFRRDYRSEMRSDGTFVYTMISGPRCGGRSQPRPR